MKLDKRKNVKRGIQHGVINRIVTLLLPFLVRTVLIQTLGAEYVGIRGLFGSILTVLSLTELGVGTAITFNMYRPIVEDDYYTIGALLNLYKKLYRIIGFVVLGLGLSITPFLRFLIKGSYPADINLQLVFLLYLIDTVLSYWLYAYKGSLSNAYQRTDVLSRIGSIIFNSGCCLLITLLVGAISYILFQKINFNTIWQTLMIRIAGCVTIVPAVYLGLFFIRKDFRESFRWALSQIKKK